MAANTTTSPFARAEAHHRRWDMLHFAVLVLAAAMIAGSALSGCGGGVSTADMQQTHNAPPAQGTATATLTWAAPTTNVDGTQLTTLAGYKVYYGTTPGVYSSIDVGPLSAGPVITYQVVGLTKGQLYYFAVTAYDTNGNESDYSLVVSKVIG